MSSIVAVIKTSTDLMKPKRFAFTDAQNCPEKEQNVIVAAVHNCRHLKQPRDFVM